VFAALTIASTSSVVMSTTCASSVQELKVSMTASPIRTVYENVDRDKGQPFNADAR
jgi:hypothetical protein